MKIVWTLATGLAMLGTACQDDSRFADKKEKVVKFNTDDNLIARSDTDESIEVVDSLVDDASVALLSYGLNDPAIDYLFVLDNSGSMSRVITRINEAFAGLVQDATFPRNSKVAVMTTMVADPNNFNVVSNDVSLYRDINDEPGFLDFVDQASIQKFRDTGSGYASRYPADGCANKWFSPEDLNGQGSPCLSAATQNAISGIGLEAGITAYEQLIQKHKENQLFREDALLNVIFVSDTHDPGKNNQNYITNRKNYAQLDALTKNYQKISSLKFHAMAPAKKCGGEDTWDFSYYTLADASKGVKGDVCTAVSFVDFLEKMVAASTVQEPVFKLTKKATEILSVSVEGELTEDYTLSEDGLSVRIEGLDPGKKVGVIIEFE